MSAIVTAKRRYTTTLLGNAVAYLVSLLGITLFLNATPDFPLGAKIALGAVPALFVLGMLRAIWVYLGRMDEVARHFAVRSILLATFAVLAVSGTWGLLEMIVDELPRIGVFWMFALFFGVMGVSSAVSRDGTCAL